MSRLKSLFSVLVPKIHRKIDFIWGEFLYPTITHQSCRPSNRVKRLLAAISVSTAMFTKMWKMPSGRDIAKEYQSRSRWLKQLNATVNGGADSHEDY